MNQTALNKTIHHSAVISPSNPTCGALAQSGKKTHNVISIDIPPAKRVHYSGAKIRKFGDDPWFFKKIDMDTCIIAIHIADDESVSFDNRHMGWALDNHYSKSAGAKQYLNESPLNMFQIMLSETAVERNVYSMPSSLMGDKFGPFGDVDKIKIVADSAEIATELCAQAIRRGLTAMFENVGIDIAEDEILLEFANKGLVDDKWECSAHWKINKHNCYFDKMIHHKCFVEHFGHVFEEATAEFGLELDIAVYHSEGRCYRTTYSTKYNQDRPFVPYPNLWDEQNYEQFKIRLPSYVIGSDGILSNLIESLGIVPKKKVVAHRQAGQRQVSTVRTTSRDEATIYESISFLTGLSGQRIARTIEVNEQKFIFCVMDGICPRGLCKHSLADEGKGSFVVERRYHEILSIRTECWRGTCQKKFGACNSFAFHNNGIMRKYKGGDEKKKKDKLLNKKETLSLLALFEMLFPTGEGVVVDRIVECYKKFDVGMGVHEYSAQYLDNLSFNALVNTLVVKSETGTGKSHSIQRMLMAGIIDKTFKSVLVVLSRQSLIHGTGAGFRKLCAEKRFEHLGKSYKLPKDSPFECYMDMKNSKEYQKCKFLICTPDSLKYLYTGDDYVWPVFDAVWVDESESVISYIATSTTLNGKRRDCWRDCENVIKDCKHFIASDADCSELTLEYVRELRDIKKTLLIHNTRKTNTKRYAFIPSFDRGLQKLQSFIRRGKNIYVACDTKKQCLLLAHILKENGHLVVEDIKKNGDQEPADGKCKVLVYTGESCAQQKESIKDYDTLWQDYDLVLTTPTIDYGLDVNGDHFDIVVAFFTGHSLNYKGCSQMMERVRKPNDGRVVVVLSSFNAPKKTMPLEEYRQKIRDEKRDHYLDIQKTTGLTDDIRALLDTVRGVDENGNVRNVIVDTLYSKCFARVDHINHVSKQQFMQQLIDRIAQSGGKVILPSPRWHVEHLIDTETLINNKKVAKLVALEAEYLYTNSVFEADDLDDEEAEIKSNIQNDPTVTAQLERHKIKKLYGVEKPSYRLIEKHGHPKKRTMFYNFINIVQIEDYANNRANNTRKRDMEEVYKAALSTYHLIREMMKELGLEFWKEQPDGSIGGELRIPCGSMPSTALVELVKKRSGCSLTNKSTKATYANFLCTLLRNHAGPLLIGVKNAAGGKNQHGSRARRYSLYRWNVEEHLHLLCSRMKKTGCNYILEECAKLVPDPAQFQWTIHQESLIETTIYLNPNE